MNKQERMIERIKRALEEKITCRNERFDTVKEIKKFEVTDLGAGDIKMVYFKTNYIDGNCFTEMTGQLFVGKRGGLRGGVRTFNNTCKVNSGTELYKVAMWV